MGVDTFKTDFGERIPTDVVYHDGSDPVRMHNYYPLLYNRCVFEVLEETLGKGQACVFARSATTGGQQFPVHWGGDSTATFESMAESLRGGLSLCTSGFGFWSHDIGGFEQTASADVYKRWCAFGLLSSHSRLHGSSSYRVPWLFDEAGHAGPTASDVLRFFTKLKCRLMPYLYAAAVEAHETGVPVMRAMPLEFPGDPACDTLDRQYMLGERLLVAPVFTPDGTVDYYLPAGRWTNFLSGEMVEGGRWLREQHGYLSLPLMVRPNTVLPVGANEDRPDYDYADGVTYPRLCAGRGRGRHGPRAGAGRQRRDDRRGAPRRATDRGLGPGERPSRGRFCCAASRTWPRWRAARPRRRRWARAWSRRRMCVAWWFTCRRPVFLAVNGLIHGLFSPENRRLIRRRRPSYANVTALQGVLAGKRKGGPLHRLYRRGPSLVWKN